MYYVKKRDGSIQEYDIKKIFNAINAASIETERSEEGYGIPEEDINAIVEDVSHEASMFIQFDGNNAFVDIEDIQDIVQNTLMINGFYKVATNYIEYRHKRKLAREFQARDESILALIEGHNEELNKENSNKNAKIASTQRDYMAGEVSKDLALRVLLPEDIVKAHKEGIIHVHDLDYYSQKIHNCDLVNLEDMLQNGTIINGTLIEKPKSFRTACTIATQIIAQVASVQHGGQTVTLSHLAPFVDISRQKTKEQVKQEFLLTGSLPSDKIIDMVTESRVAQEIKDGIQTFQYQVNTIMSTNGQSPFLTVFMYLNEVEDGRTREDLALIIEEVLRQRIIGTKNESGVYITPAFPKLIYALQEDNVNKDGKYRYLTDLAIKCTAKRLVPDYISEKKMKEIKEGVCFPSMGCVDGEEIVTYKHKGTLYVESFDRMWNRFEIEFGAKLQDNGEDYYIDLEEVEIYDTKLCEFTQCYRIINNVASDWVEVTTTGYNDKLFVTHDHPFETQNRGVVLARDLQPSDEILVSRYHHAEFDEEFSEALAFIIGTGLFAKQRIVKGHVPNKVFRWDVNAKYAFLNGVFKACSDYIITDDGIHKINCSSKEVTLQLFSLMRSLGISANTTCTYGNQTCTLSFEPDNRLLGKSESTEGTFKVGKTKVDTVFISDVKPVHVVKNSYDVTTESEHFEFSGVYSHNCRSFLSPWKDENGNYKYYGRFNLGVCTINLVDVALSSGGDFDKFWEIFDERLDLCKRMGICRYERLKGTTSDVAPILWQGGALARLKKGEVIDELLTGGYSTVSLGYGGLYECVKYMTGVSHTDEQGTPFAIAVMQHMKDKCQEWKKETNLGFGLYGTPMENTTYTFAKCLKKRFGVIEGITDKNYITNSYHVHVTEHIDPFTKLKFESQFQEISDTGCISYVETGNLQDNLDAIDEVVQFIYDNIMYAELNTKSDYCQVCGYDGELLIDDNMEWYCPNCGNDNQNMMNVSRRSCGYIGSHFWSYGRTQEIKERYVHLGGDDEEQ